MTEIQPRLFARHNERAVDRLVAHRSRQGDRGGKSDRDAHYLDPTLFSPITWDDKIMEDGSSDHPADPDL